MRYSTHSEAARAIQIGNARVLCGKPLKCSWGSKPTPAGASSTPLPPPVQALGYTAADLAAYERQLALAKMSGVHALMGQHPLKAPMGMGAPGGSQPIYDPAYQNLATSQQLMYYH